MQVFIEIGNFTRWTGELATSKTASDGFTRVRVWVLLDSLTQDIDHDCDQSDAILRDHCMLVRLCASSKYPNARDMIAKAALVLIPSF